MIRWVLRLAIARLGALAPGPRTDSCAAVPPVADRRPLESLIVIDAPIERVWAVVADIEGQPRWMHDMKSVRMLTTGPIGVGTRGEATVRILGMSVTDPVTVTEFEPPTPVRDPPRGHVHRRRRHHPGARRRRHHDDRPLGRRR